MKLGKLAPEFSDQDLRFSNVLRAVPVPDAYDSDAAINFPGDSNMYGNDRYGDCVMAGRAHQTLRFEWKETASLLAISDQEVEAEYFHETHGLDSGLVVSRSLKQWRNPGWTIGGKNYKIQSYARLDTYNRTQLKSAMFADLGVGIGFTVTEAAMDAFNAGLEWDITPGNTGILGGHYVYCVAYDPTGVTCVTWGKRQKMTWAFWDKYVDESWAIIDAKDSKGLIDLGVIKAFLASL